MKSIVLLAFITLAFSSSVHAEPPSLFQNMEKCTFYAAKASSYTTVASILPDDQIQRFQTYIQTDVDQYVDTQAKQLLVMLANIAWRNKHDTPTNVGMAVYEDCVKHTGTST